MDQRRDRERNPKDLLHIVSIRHTGTHTLQEVFGCDKTHVHQHPEQKPGMNSKIIFVPLRDPKKVWESWTKRFPDDDITHYINNQTQFIAEWLALDEFGKQFACHYIPVDKCFGDTIKLGVAEPNDAYPSRIEQYPWVPAFDFIYSLPFVAEYYAPGP